MAEEKWTDFAIEELNQIGEFIALDSIRYAELTVSQLFSSTEILEKYPLRVLKSPEFKTKIFAKL